jgi:hypothetical protein
LAVCDLSRDLGDVLVECPADVVVIAEYERLLDVESYGDDVFRVLDRIPLCLLHFQFMLEQEFLIVCQKRKKDDTHEGRRWEMTDLSVGRPAERQRLPAATSVPSQFPGQGSVLDGCVLGEHERDDVAYMHTIATWAPPRIEEKRFAVLVSVKDLVKLAG